MCISDCDCCTNRIVGRLIAIANTTFCFAYIAGLVLLGLKCGYDCYPHYYYEYGYLLIMIFSEAMMYSICYLISWCIIKKENKLDSFYGFNICMMIIIELILIFTLIFCIWNFYDLVINLMYIYGIKYPPLYTTMVIINIMWNISLIIVSVVMLPINKKQKQYDRAPTKDDVYLHPQQTEKTPSIDISEPSIDIGRRLSTEKSIKSCYAVIYEWFNKDWIAVDDITWSKVDLLHDTEYNSYRIVARDTKSNKELMNCNISEQCEYKKKCVNFYTFIDENGKNYGLSFHKTGSWIKQATDFSMTMVQVLKQYNNNNKEMDELELLPFPEPKLPSKDATDFILQNMNDDEKLNGNIDSNDNKEIDEIKLRMSHFTEEDLLSELNDIDDELDDVLIDNVANNDINDDIQQENVSNDDKIDNIDNDEYNIKYDDDDDDIKENVIGIIDTMKGDINDNMDDSTKQFYKFLQRNQLEKYFNNFRDNKCANMSYIEVMDDDKLKDIGISMNWDRAKLLTKCLDLKQEIKPFKERISLSLFDKLSSHFGIISIDILCDQIENKSDLKKLNINNKECDILWRIIENDNDNNNINEEFQPEGTQNDKLTLNQDIDGGETPFISN